MNIGVIKKTQEMLIAAAEAAIAQKEDKANPTDRDQEIVSALEDYMGELESALDNLLSVYES